MPGFFSLSTKFLLFLEISGIFVTIHWNLVAVLHTSPNIWTIWNKESKCDQNKKIKTSYRAEGIYKLIKTTSPYLHLVDQLMKRKKLYKDFKLRGLKFNIDGKFFEYYRSFKKLDKVCTQFTLRL